jgi:hypothetical protein
MIMHVIRESDYSDTVIYVATNCIDDLISRKRLDSLSLINPFPASMMKNQSILI